MYLFTAKWLFKMMQIACWKIRKLDISSVCWILHFATHYLLKVIFTWRTYVSRFLPFRKQPWSYALIDRMIKKWFIILLLILQNKKSSSFVFVTCIFLLTKISLKLPCKWISSLSKRWQLNPTKKGLLNDHTYKNLFDPILSCW